MKIAGYEIIRELGAGGMATVYLAIQAGFDREVAFKVMSPRLTADASFADRFLREAKIVARLSHPHIVAVYDVGVDEGQHYIAMEYHPGGDLATRMQHGLALESIAETVAQVAMALDYAHEKGYVHRDIKPGNVVFGVHDQAVLTDFGIARAAHSAATPTPDGGAPQTLTQVGAVLGTPAYMSPEQARGLTLDGRSDLYSLGIMFFELLTGKVPFAAEDAIAVGIKHIGDPIPRLPERVALYQDVIDKLLAKDREARFQTGHEVVAALDSIDPATDTPSATEFVPAISGDTARPKSRKGLAIAAAIGLLVLGAGAGFWRVGLPGTDKAQPPVSLPPPRVVVAIEGSAASQPQEPEAAQNEPKEKAAERRVAGLLTQAENAFNENRLTQPEGESAIDYANEILRANPDNKRALALRTRVGIRFYELAQLQVRRGNVDMARSRFAKGRLYAPGQPAESVAAAAIAEAESRPSDLMATMIISGKLELARTALETGNHPEAGIKYREVLELDSTNQEAHKGLLEISRLAADR